MFQWMGCRHSSVESSAPTILPPRVRVPSMPSTLFHLFVLYLSCEKNENKQKEAGFGPFLEKMFQRIKTNLVKYVYRIGP